MVWKPYSTPFADIPMISTAPRFAETNARPVTQKKQTAAREEEVNGGGNAGFCSPANSQDKEEVQSNEQIIHPGCVESQY